LRLPLYAVLALVVAKMTGDVVTEDFEQLRLLVWTGGKSDLKSSYLFRMQCFRCLRFPVDSRLTGEKASSLQVGKVETEDVLVGMTAAAVVECMGSLGHLVRRMHEGVRVGSMSRTVVVGKPPVLLRCRVPCLRDASP
jgi:hypothetical protein